MSGKAFFDTNVLVYATAEHDRRWPVATALLAGGGTISAQVLNEFANVARRKLKWTWAEIKAGLVGFQTLCPDPLPIGVATHDAALVIAERDGIAFYDALIVASALEAGCATLFTEDFQDGRVIDGRLSIRNPFTAS